MYYTPYPQMYQLVPYRLESQTCTTKKAKNEQHQARNRQSNRKNEGKVKELQNFLQKLSKLSQNSEKLKLQ